MKTEFRHLPEDQIADIHVITGAYDPGWQDRERSPRLHMLGKLWDEILQPVLLRGIEQKERESGRKVDLVTELDYVVMPFWLALMWAAAQGYSRTTEAKIWGRSVVTREPEAASIVIAWREPGCCLLCGGSGVDFTARGESRRCPCQP